MCTHVAHSFYSKNSMSFLMIHRILNIKEAQKKKEKELLEILKMLNDIFLIFALELRVKFMPNT